jgi:hypothetical protein
MSDLPNISQNNEQILNDIQSLQQMEQALFNNLETDMNLTPQQQQKIIEKMNQLTKMRINLYQTLSGVNNFFDSALKSSVGTLKDQSTAIRIVEDELNTSKKRLELLKAEKNNKIRLVEINDYYGDKYAEHSQLMKIIIFTLVPVIILSILNNKGILPNTIYYILIVIVSFIGAIFIVRRYISIIMRHNMNYQEYNFPFDPNNAPKGTSTDGDDPWLSLKVNGTCVGQYCCSDDQTYDSELNRCIGKTTESFVTQSNINDVLTKKQNGKFKDDVNLGDIFCLNEMFL